MAVCTVCNTNWCGCGGGGVCGACKRGGKTRRVGTPSTGPTAKPTPSAGPVVAEAPKSYVTMPGAGPTGG